MPPSPLPAARCPTRKAGRAGNLSSAPGPAQSPVSQSRCARRAVLRAQYAEQSVLLVVDTRSEPERVGPTGRRSTGQQAPQARLGERLAGRLVNGLARDVVSEGTVVLGNDVDPAITEVADEERAGGRTPAGRRDSQAPGRVERAARGDAGDQAPVGAELAAEALTDRFPARARVGLVEGHEDVAVQRLRVERLEAARQPRVPELPGSRLDLLECRIEDIDLALAEVGGE